MFLPLLEIFHRTETRSPKYPGIVDATRLSDGEMVALKKVETPVYPDERGIAEFFSSGTIASDPRNHCVPIYGVLEVPEDPDTIILIMPLLRTFYMPAFYTVGEIVDFLTQIFEVRLVASGQLSRQYILIASFLKGFHFMHEHLVAHR